MSYREDFIRLAIHKHHQDPSDPVSQNFLRTAGLIRGAKIIRIRGEQSAVFLDAPVHETQDWKRWLRLPFPVVYIEPEQPFAFPGYDHGVEQGIAEAIANGADQEEIDRLRMIERVKAPLIRGVVLAEGDSIEGIRVAKAGGEGGPWPSDIGVDLKDAPIVRLILAAFLLPVPGFELNMHIMTTAILDDGRLAVSLHGHMMETRRRMRGWVIHTVNFLSSPSVKLVAREHSRELQRARAKKGKDPLPGWYEITYRRHVQEYGGAKIAVKRWEHSFRYDVRGHFKRFERGAMAGRVIWSPPHQRGVKHVLYKPKGYREEAIAE